MQMTLNKPLRELMQETDTRWNTMYNMMGRFMKQTALAAVDCEIESLTLVECSAVQQLLHSYPQSNL
jgi:hypothetical protein